MALVKIIKDYNPSEGWQVGEIVDITDPTLLIAEGKVIPVDESGKELFQEDFLSFGLPVGTSTNQGGRIKNKKKSPRYFYLEHEKQANPDETAPQYFDRITEQTLFDLGQASLLLMGYKFRDEVVMRDQVMSRQGKQFVREVIDAVKQAVQSKVNEIDDRTRRFQGRLKQHEKRGESFKQDQMLIRRSW